MQEKIRKTRGKNVGEKRDLEDEIGWEQDAEREKLK